MTQNAGVAAGSRWTDWVSLGILASSVPRDVIDDTVEAAGRQAKRSDGKLPPHVRFYFAMAMALFAEDDYEKVAARLAGLGTDVLDRRAFAQGGSLPGHYERPRGRRIDPALSRAGQGTAVSAGRSRHWLTANAALRAREVIQFPGHCAQVADPAAALTVRGGQDFRCRAVDFLAGRSS